MKIPLTSSWFSLEMVEVTIWKTEKEILIYKG